jgi:inner membrane protein
VAAVQRPPGTQRVDVLPLFVAAAVLVLHQIAGARQWPPVVMGAVDEPAHLLTAWLILAALPGGLLTRSVGRWALVASVAIDVDHIPLYLWGRDFSVDGRPPTHSLAFVLALLAIAVLLPRSPRERVVGVALGVALHLVRDLATGPGVPLLWPAYDSSAIVPQDVYLIAVAAVAVVAAVRPRRGELRRRG